LHKGKFVRMLALLNFPKEFANGLVIETGEKRPLGR
jgi:hypothetical protein